jgi:uracil-DNA glycosylase
VFVGNDFGTLQSYERLRKKGYENPPTWRHIKQRVRDAHLPQELTFFTNAVLGLRIEGKALDEKGWGKRPDFAKFCRTFLVYQIEMLRPKLVVVLGQQSRPIVESLTVEESIYDGQVTPRRTKIGNHTTAICCTTHPFGDNFKPDRKAQEAVLLRAAWTFAEELRY